MPRRNWRWMLSSGGIGGGLGLVAGLQRLGMEPATISGDVATAIARAGVTIFILTWLVVVATRFARLLWTYRRLSQGAVQK